jgi:hypothetical protein
MLQYIHYKFMKIIMDIDKVLKNPRLVQAVLGVSKKEFESLVPVFSNIITQDRNSRKRKRKIGGGSNGKIKDPVKKLFFILWYVKVYPTFDVAAYVFASSKSRTHYWAHNILPLLEKTLKRKIVLPQRQISTPEEFLALFPFTKEVMLDGVERPTIRSRKEKVQRKHYSGKKKRHMRKNVVVVDNRKRILLVSPSKHGKVHDKKLNDKAIIASRIPESVSILADTGFVGITKQHDNTLIPKKKPRGKFLTSLEKEMNCLISSCRIKVEHALGGMKRFGAVSHIYRNKNGWDDSLVRVCAGLWNLHLDEKVMEG